MSSSAGNSSKKSSSQDGSKLNFIDMKLLVAFAALMAVVIAAPLDSEITVVNETPSDNIGVADYKFGYQLSNGATREETAQLTDAGTEDQYYRIVGSYSWINPVDNVQYITKYTADKDGFRAEGDHIPV
ncbi:flexible cuticle protein 12-like [Athalia rosae]|uniref:flexible cuticle protein 12-like n=1 Tax=Athalia rosae TaxID=37344 RepID=UPI0020335CBB|nr:flexible cuticle protein 12-like [Athalia rosae]